jgi:hypothetical protein
MRKSGYNGWTRVRRVFPRFRVSVSTLTDRSALPQSSSWSSRRFGQIRTTRARGCITDGSLAEARLRARLVNYTRFCH